MRRIAALGVIATAILVWSVAAQHSQGPVEQSAGLMQLVPALWPDGNVPSVAAVWILRTRGAVCDDSARKLRRLRALLGKELPIVVMAVGDGTAEWLEAFLRRERLSGEIVELAEAVFLQQFGEQHPRLVLLLNGEPIPIDDIDQLRLGAVL